MGERQPSDAAIIAASLQRPEEFGQIFSRHHTAVYRFAARRLGETEAGDVAADVFDRAFRLRARYDQSKPSCLPWLYGITHNIVGDRLRRVRRGRRVYVVAAEREAIDDEAAASDERVVADRTAFHLNAALRKLSRKDRDTLLLYALESLTYPEIARVLGIPVGTVSSRISRARRQILDAIPDLRQITSAEEPPQPPGRENG